MMEVLLVMADVNSNKIECVKAGMSPVSWTEEKRGFYMAKLKNRVIKQSVFRKENGMMKKFFGHLKTEMFYNQ